MVLPYQRLVFASMCVRVPCRRVHVHEPAFVRVDLVSTCSVCQRPVTLGMPHSACPEDYIWQENRSYYDKNTKKMVEYEYRRWERNPASCGKDTDCPAAISSINDTVFSEMKTGFAVRV